MNDPNREFNDLFSEPDTDVENEHEPLIPPAELKKLYRQNDLLFLGADLPEENDPEYWKVHSERLQQLYADTPEAKLKLKWYEEHGKRLHEISKADSDIEDASAFRATAKKFAFMQDHLQRLQNASDLSTELDNGYLVSDTVEYGKEYADISDKNDISGGIKEIKVDRLRGHLKITV